jgi:P-type conjugative transfer protein TrbJ
MKKIFSITLCILSGNVYAELPVIDFSALIQLRYQVEQLTEQTKYVRMELQQLDDAQYQWSDVRVLINHLAAIIQQMHGIAYNAANINQQFQQTYPGYQAAQDFSQQYKNNTNTTLNTLNGVLQSVGSSAQNFQNESIHLAYLQQQVQSAAGQTQAIQASTQIVAEIAAQLQLLRQAVIAQTNAQTAYYALQVQHAASSKAELEKIIRAGSTDIPEYGTSGYIL